MKSEAEYQASIVAAVGHVFPWLKKDEYDIERTFTIKVGRKSIKIDADRDYRASGRADVILKHAGGPLAVLELKKPGAGLKPEDGDQGLSYANLLAPRAPLVVIAAGEEVRLIDAYTRQIWEPDKGVVTQTELAKRMKATSVAAAPTSPRLSRPC